MPEEARGSTGAGYDSGPLWTQVAVVFAAVMASRADRGLFPYGTLPVEPAMGVAVFGSLIAPLFPITVVVLAIRRRLSFGRIVLATVATILLMLATYFAILPMVSEDR